MNGFDFKDTLEPLGIGVGVLLVLVGLGTLAGQPWATLNSTGALVIQLVGVLALFAIGAALAWLSYER
jgi:VIT1/CCC1 family predicted Fe2+/Mn2+ transporter